MNRVKFVGIIAIIAIIALSLTSCPTNGNGNGNGNGTQGALGSTLNLSGQVWMPSEGSAGPTWTPFTGSRVVYSTELGAVGSIANGQLSFTVTGMPSNLMSVGDVFTGSGGMFFNNVSISNPSARAIFLPALNTSGDGRSGWLHRVFYTNTSVDIVARIFVDRNVTITGSGRSTTLFECDCEEWEGSCSCTVCNCAYILTTQNLNLSLRTGWNTVHQRRVLTGNTTTMTMTLGDPANMRWILEESNGFSDNLQPFEETIEHPRRTLFGIPSLRTRQ